MFWLVGMFENGKYILQKILTEKLETRNLCRSSAFSFRETPRTTSKSATTKRIVSRTARSAHLA